MKLHRQLHISGQGLQVTLSLRQTDLLTLTLTLTPTLGRDRYLSRQMKRLIQFRRYRHVDLYGYDSRKEFTKLWQLAGTGRGPGITEKNRFTSDQIRARLHCYGLLAKELPNYSNIGPGLQGKSSRTLARPSVRIREKIGLVYCDDSPPSYTFVAGTQGAKVFLSTVIEYFKRSKKPEEFKLPLIGSHRITRNHLDMSAEKASVYLTRLAFTCIISRSISRSSL